MKIENVQVENVTDECIIWLQDWLGKGGDVKFGFSIFIIRVSRNCNFEKIKVK